MIFDEKAGDDACEAVGTAAAEMSIYMYNMDLSTQYQGPGPPTLTGKFRRFASRARGFVSGEIVSFLAAVCKRDSHHRDRFAGIERWPEMFGAAVCAVA